MEQEFETYKLKVNKLFEQPRFIILSQEKDRDERKKTEINTVLTYGNNQSVAKNNKDYTHYSILGGSSLAKNRFVLEVVRKFVNEHPGTYNEYAKIFNALKSDAQGVVKEYNSLLENQIRNYFTSEKDCLVSIDGVKFVVCKQWTIDMMRPIIQFANSQGYNVVEYK